MTEPRETYDNFIHLSVAVTQSGVDMIQQIGVLTALRRNPDRGLRPGDMLDLRKALSKAVHALESYDEITRTGPQSSTNEEFVAARNQVAEINWCSNAEASKALGQGLVPPECSINEAGALVIPETQAGQFVRGSSLIRAYFDEIVTTGGTVVKSRNGVREMV
jgi:hypothetical protein